MDVGPPEMGLAGLADGRRLFGLPRIEEPAVAPPRARALCYDGPPNAS